MKLVAEPPALSVAKQWMTLGDEGRSAIPLRPEKDDQQCRDGA
jgi:hypothetical protein